MNQIHWRCLCWRADEDGFVSLKAAYLNRVIDPRVLKELRPTLVEAGVLNWDSSYIKGQRSMRFRIREPFQRTRRVECSSRKVCRRIWRLQDQAERRLLPVHRWLRDRLKMLKFDLHQAESIIAGMVPDPDTPLTVGEYRALIIEQAQRLNQQMTDGTPELSVCRYGRVHTAITRLPATLRRCLSFDGEPLVGIDLRNSQPLFAGLMALECMRSRQSRSRLLKFEPSVTSPYGRSRSTTPTPPHTPPITIGEMTEVVESNSGYKSYLADKPDLKMYLERCEQGEFYDSLMLPGEDRGRFKQRIFADVLFGRDSFRSQIRARFSAQYPTVAAMLADLKQHDFRRPSWLMQSRESTLFVGRVCRRIMADRPDISLATIHDSFLVTEPHAEYVEGIALDEFARLGVKPTFKHETYC
ncbi:MAG: hypothetical protein ISQ06_07170 [Planctomycetaceae bacterium]|nr:hypothetical protein [Planctomycetaceae bacterium]